MKRKILYITEFFFCTSHLVAMAFLLFCLVTTVSAQPKQGMKVKGQVLDESGASLAGADVTLTESSGKSLQTISSEKGEFEFSSVSTGAYILKVSVLGFNSYESESFKVEKSVVAPLEKILMN
ncbi:MAG: Cna protein B-type domain-containing protein [bacterium]|nr:MAG: Cna protein B-type domain-containing protein [bacterium]